MSQGPFLRWLAILYLWFCTCFHYSVSGEETKVLHLLGLEPGDDFIKNMGKEVIYGFETGLKDVGTRNDILPTYNLQITWGESGCNPGKGVNAMFEQIYQPPQKIMMVGDVCSPVSEILAMTAPLWNLVQVSYGSVSPALSDEVKYPLFFRLTAPAQEMNLARLQIMKDFNWKRVATVHEPYEIFSKVIDDLVERIHDNNMTIITSELLADNPKQVIANMKHHDVRIICTNFYHTKAPEFFCEAYKQGLYGPKYVWFIESYYDDEWWMEREPSNGCTIEEISKVAEGMIYTGATIVRPKGDVKGIGGLTADDFYRIHSANFEGFSGNSLMAIAYDTAWAVALGLNQSLQSLKERGLNRSLEHFTYRDEEIRQAIYESMFTVKFQGLRGWIDFNEVGESSAIIYVERTQNGVRYNLGNYNPFSKQMVWNPENPIIWYDGRPPADSTTYREETLFIDHRSYIAMCVITALGVILSLFFGGFNIIFRNERCIKMSSPRINNMILLGCMLTYITIYLQELSQENVLIFCKLRMSTLMIGFSLVFGGLFTKTWRVYIIFMNRTKKMIIRDGQLFMVMSAIVGLDIVILVIREIVDPATAIQRNIETIELDGGETIITQKVWLCTSEFDIYFKGVIYTIKGLLLIFGAFLAWQTRKVKISALNDSQNIGVCIYNVAVLCLLGVVLAFALQDDVTLVYITSCCVIILATTTTQLVIFLPKMKSFASTENQVEDTELRNTMTAPSTFSATPSTQIPGASIASKLKKTEQLLLEAEQRIIQQQTEINEFKSIMH